MAQKLYRVVETRWTKQGRVSVDIGCAWKQERAARNEMRELSAKHQGQGRLFSLEATK